MVKIDNIKTIREINDIEGIRNSTSIIKKSFSTVAKEFGFTRENCPTHPSFITIKQLKQLNSKGLTFFGLFPGENQVGFVAVEKADEELYYMEKLAVLPEHRHKGYGKELTGFVIDFIRNNGGKKIGIGIIDEHNVLKNWYKGLGFKEINTQKFAHLPFTVCFMERDTGMLK